MLNSEQASRPRDRRFRPSLACRAGLLRLPAPCAKVAWLAAPACPWSACRGQPPSILSARELYSMRHAKPASSKPGSRRVNCFPLCPILISLLSALTAVAAEPQPAPRYNLLVISIDTLRADHLTCYGYNRDTSPHLDQLAREGVLFENLTAVMFLDGAVAHEHAHLALSQRPRRAGRR